VILVGGDFIKTTHSYRFFEDAGQAAAWLKAQQPRDGLFLVKGSRSMKMERVMTAFENEN
jgi:UDP-N-acetylmuramoyl-tripeptide--D-alanyl-D-alanine ligase